MFIKYNPNPCGKSVGDCTIRALSKAFNVDWESMYISLALSGLVMGDLPDSDKVWNSYLKKNGFYRCAIADDLPDNYTVSDFANDNPRGVFILSMPGQHAVTVIDGDYYDSWDSGQEEPVYYWRKDVQ